MAKLPELKDEDSFTFSTRKHPKENTFTFEQPTIGALMDFEEALPKTKGYTRFKLAADFFDEILVKKTFKKSLMVYIRGMRASEFLKFMTAFQQLFIEEEKK